MSETSDGTVTVTIHHSGGSLELDYDRTEADEITDLIKAAAEPNSWIDFEDVDDKADIHIFTNHIFRIDVSK